jgi:hypothetical protein
VSWSARIRGVRLQQLIKLAKDLHGSSPSSSFPNTRGQRREGCYSRISTRGVRGCWEGQGGGLVKFQIILN